MRTVYRMLVISIATGVLSIIASEPGKRKSSVAYTILVVVSFAAYNAFLLGMYLYEMPESSVGSFERYQKIQYVMILLMGVVLFVSNIRPIKKMKYQAIPAALLCGMLLWQGRTEKRTVQISGLG